MLPKENTNNALEQDERKRRSQAMPEQHGPYLTQSLLDLPQLRLHAHQFALKLINLPLCLQVRLVAMMLWCGLRDES